MKRITVVYIIFILAGIGSAMAQSINSKEDSFSTLYGEDVIVRTIPGDPKPLIYYKGHDGNHYIVYHNAHSYLSPFSSTSFQFPTHITDAEYKINDIVVINDRCYFCGSCTSPADGTEGLVGRIDLNSLNATPPSADFIFLTIKEVKEFYRIDGTNNTTDYLALVGTTKNSPNPSGVAFVTWDGTLWHYRVYNPDNDDETFTDIVFTMNGQKVVAVSRLNDKPYRFYLRGELTDTAFNLPATAMSNFVHRNTVRTDGLAPQGSTNPHPTWHYNDVDMRLVANLSEDEEITVAYECYDDTKPCESQMVALFQVDLSGFPANPAMNVTGKQAVFGYFNQPNTLMDVQYIPEDETIGLLHKCTACPNERTTVVQFPSWNGYGYIDALQVGPQAHSSMNVYDNKHIYLAGVDPSDDHLLFFRQDKTLFEHSCYLTYPPARSEALTGNDWGVSHYGHDVKLLIRDEENRVLKYVSGTFKVFFTNCQTAY